MSRAGRFEERYAPGWTGDAVSMMRSRSSSRLAFLAPHLREGMRVLDVGCGPGTITAAIAEAVGFDGAVVGVDLHEGQIEEARRLRQEAGLNQLSFEIGSVYRLPVGDGEYDIVFAHGLFEHLARPHVALVEVKRVLKPSGLVAICSSDWSGAEVEPMTPDVTRALRGHFLLRRKAGGDPYAGGFVPGLLRSGGWHHIEVSSDFYADLSYTGLARYIEARLEAAADEQAADRLIGEALAGARRWREGPEGTFRQCWVACVAQRP
jgi:ubiquinone/menaquinone biosynthesis C-methylase UbiE